jgi:phosphoglycerate dehydrogenase-like enzyme
VASSNAAARLKIHIENDPDAPPALRISATRLQARLGQLPDFAGDIEITTNDTPALMPARIDGADVLLACRKLSIREAKAASAALAWTQLITAGVESYLPDLPKGVLLTNASGVHADKGAEFILTAVLMLNYNIPQFISDKQDRNWRPVFGGTVAGKVVTLLGVGGIGRAAARLLLAHGVSVVGVTRSGTTDVAVSESRAVTELDAILPRTDVLVSTLPLTAETAGLVDGRRLALLPRGAGIVVVGRARVFDYAALAERLRSGELGGAVLEVFPEEPVPLDSELWTCPRLVITPHCSLDDHTSYIDRCLDIFCDNVFRFRSGAPLRNLIDPARGY